MLKTLCRAEIVHVREFKDSLLAARSRIGSFINRRRTSFTAPFAPALLALRAEYLTFFGMADSAMSEYEALKNYYGSSVAYRQSLDTKLINAFNKNDTVVVENVMNEILLAGLDSVTIRNARTQRRAFYRCRRQGMLPKTVNTLKNRGVPAETMYLEVYPNPVNDDYARITLHVPEDMYITVGVYAIDGKEVGLQTTRYYRKGNPILRLDVSILPAGVYLCHAKSGRISGNAKLIVDR